MILESFLYDRENELESFLYDREKFTMLKK